jgi:hypothetical protein
MASESTENIRNEVESIVNEAVSRIYKQGQKVLDAFNWAVDQIKRNFHTIYTSS